MSTMIPGASYGAYGGYGSYAAAPAYSTSYAAAPMASYAPAVSTGYAGVPAYGATTYGMSGMGAGMGHNPAMSLDFIKKTEEDTTGIIVGQADQQKKMLDHQYEAQKKMLEAEAKRTIDITTQQ
jgi:hypothetical protein